jgi:hypothetical protein
MERLATPELKALMFSMDFAVAARGLRFARLTLNGAILDSHS